MLRDKSIALQTIIAVIIFAIAIISLPYLADRYYRHRTARGRVGSSNNNRYCYNDPAPSYYLMQPIEQSIHIEPPPCIVLVMRN